MTEDCIEKEEIDGLIFCQTVFLCPELYEIYDREGRHVGYARLRWGVLRCDFPDCGGVTIYRKDFESEYLGGFRTEGEREKYLKIIAEKLNERLAGIGGRQAIEINGLRFIRENEANPELWLIYCQGEYVAWLILNNGFLECRAADGSEEKIFGQKIKPDAGRDFACFENDVQRMRYLRIIADKLGKMACL